VDKKDAIRIARELRSRAEELADDLSIFASDLDDKVLDEAERFAMGTAGKLDALIHRLGKGD